jgi:uncharacterized membrane protein YhhN
MPITLGEPPATLGVVPFLIGWVCYQLYRRGEGIMRSMGRAAAALCIVALAMAPWLIRNFETFHKPVFLRDGLWLEI